LNKTVKNDLLLRCLQFLCIVAVDCSQGKLGKKDTWKDSDYDLIMKVSALQMISFSVEWNELVATTQVDFWLKKMKNVCYTKQIVYILEYCGNVIIEIKADETHYRLI